MATDLERLTISLEANVKKFETEMRKQNAQAGRIFKELEERASRMETRVSNSFQDMAKKIAQVAGTAISIRQVQQLVDTWQEAGNKIRAAGVGDAMSAAVQNNIADIAARSRSSFADVADLYARLTRTGKDFNATQGEVAVATETVAKALKVSGASASEVQSTLVQLGQALGSGRLQGDELRSLLENAPVVAQAIAKEFGVTIGQLKDLGAEGQLVGDRVFKALVNAAPEVGEAFAKTTGTIADSFTALETAAVKFVGNSQNMTAAARLVSGSIGLVAKNFDLAANGATALGAVIAARLVAGGLTPLVMQVGAAVAGMGTAQAAAGALGARALFAAGAARTLGLALSFVGGPVGAALLGAGAAVAYLATRTTEGKDSTDRYAQAVKNLKPVADEAKAAIKGVGDEVAETNRKMDAAALSKIQSEMDNAAKKIAEAEKAMTDYRVRIEQVAATSFNGDDKARALALVERAMKGSAEEAVKAAAELKALGDVNPRFDYAFNRLALLAQAIGTAREQVRLLAADFGGLQNVQQKRGDQAALERSGFKLDVSLPDAPTVINRDPVVAALKLQGKVREAQMDENVKALRDKTKELWDAAMQSGSPVSMSQAQDAAKKIIAAEKSQKKSGGGGGGKSDEDKAEDRINRYVDSLTRQNLVLQAEIDNFGKSNIEKRAAIELAKAGVDLNRLDASTREEMLAKLQKEIGLSEELRTKLKGLEDQKKAINEANQFFAESIADSLTDLIVNGEKAEEVMKNLVKQLAKAALQAALMGSGPLAGIFGTKGTDGGVGGILGLVTSGFSIPGKAAGGPVKAGQPYVVGERRPELFVPSTSGRIVPNPRSGGGQVSVSHSPTYHVTPANGVTPEQLAVVIDRNNQQFARNLGSLLQRNQNRFA